MGSDLKHFGGTGPAVPVAEIRLLSHPLFVPGPGSSRPPWVGSSCQALQAGPRGPLGEKRPTPEPASWLACPLFGRLWLGRPPWGLAGDSERRPRSL